MASKRYKKLPEKTKDLNADVIEKLLPQVKENCTTKKRWLQRSLSRISKRKLQKTCTIWHGHRDI